jgi:hypothetical protein
MRECEKEKEEEKKINFQWRKSEAPQFVCHERKKETQKKKNGPFKRRLRKKANGLKFGQFLNP